MATLEGPGLPACQTTTMGQGNLPSQASLDSSTLPTPAAGPPPPLRTLLLQPSSPLFPSPAKPTHALSPAGLEIVPSPMPISPSPKLLRGLLYSSRHFPGTGIQAPGGVREGVHRSGAAVGAASCELSTKSAGPQL